ncbi:hypothetical protein PAEPH01_0882 [Pancytospora epiphaga]|nr:hypothetical protein PAEPH01_0882 [Pancytospora epiphaga]
MIIKLPVPSRQSKEFLSKYFSGESCYACPSKKYTKTHKPQFSNILCKFFAKDICTRGTDCSFSHDVTLFPCPEYSLGQGCTKDGCKYKHDAKVQVTVAVRPENASNTPPPAKRYFVSPFS